MESGETKLKLEPINPRELIEEVHNMLKPSVGNKNLQIFTNCQKAPEKIVTDILKLQQILTNLLSNAIRYTESGKIEINCETIDENKWKIEVSDTGIGISEEDLINIFNPYYRAAPNSKSCVIDGTGLGLAIVSQLITIIKGEIKVDSELDRGSTFTVILPLETENNYQ